MTTKQIKVMQERVGTEPDGFWGPMSIAACQKHLRALMPKPNPWPKTDQKSLTEFYGAPGDESKLAKLDVRGLGVMYDGSVVNSIRCHHKVKTSLERVLRELHQMHSEVLLDYNGCYADRAMRGGTLPSLHARGAAIDFCAATNGNRTSWPSLANMPIEVMETFAMEGWVAAGAFWGRDAMHFQATL